MKTPSELSARIRELCRAKNALILVHNYELGEVQEIADFCGDSLELSVKAAENPADILVLLRGPVHGGDRQEASLRKKRCCFRWRTPPAKWRTWRERRNCAR